MIPLHNINFADYDIKTSASHTLDFKNIESSQGNWIYNPTSNYIRNTVVVYQQ